MTNTTINKEFIMVGDELYSFKEDTGNRTPVVPPGTWTLLFSMTAGFFLRRAPDLSLPPKLYGDVSVRTNRVIDAFTAQDRSIGVLLRGDKGSGKTLLATNICLEAQKSDMPIILINRAYSGDAFAEFISSIPNDCVFLFDEFDKSYGGDQGKEAANTLLTILDGTNTTKKLFLFTCNDYTRLNEYLLARPGRVRYKWTYAGLNDDAIKEYCDDKLENPDYFKEIKSIAAITKPFTFDILKAIVAECNQFKESPLVFSSFLNIGTAEDGYARYEYYLKIGDYQMEDKLALMNGGTLNIDVTEQFNVGFTLYKGEGADRTSFSVRMVIEPDSMVDILDDGSASRLYESTLADALNEYYGQGPNFDKAKSFVRELAGVAENEEDPKLTVVLKPVKPVVKTSWYSSLL